MKKVLFIVVSGLFLSSCTNDSYDNSVDRLYRVAHKTRLDGNSEIAAKFYTKVIAAAPDMVEAYLGLAECYVDMKLLDAAESNLKIAAKKGGKGSRISYLMGKCYLLRGNLTAAKTEFSKYKTPDCMNALGAVYDNLGDHEKAQQLYKQVIVANPKYIDAYNNMGLSLMLSDNYKDAILYLENACTLPDSNPTYRSNLALAYGLSGQLQKARAVYAQDFDGEELEQKIAYLEDIVASGK